VYGVILDILSNFCVNEDNTYLVLPSVWMLVAVTWSLRTTRLLAMTWEPERTSKLLACTLHVFRWIMSGYKMKGYSGAE